LFNPEGAFVERMILQADAELLRRRAKYADAGCLVVCPPGFHGQEAGSKDEEDRAAKKIHARVQELTGRRAVLVLNGDPDSLLAEYRESNSEYLVAVNRVSEGCDIPRLRLCLLLRDLRSELLFMQIIGRIIRRRDGEDDQPALLIMAPLYHLVEWAREVTIAKAGAQPKACEPCPRCGRMPCKCPCKRCGQQRPCKCPCPDCGQRPCICPPDVDPEIFVEIHGEGEDHIIHGTDIEDQYALRAGKIRDQHAACRHQDKANIAYILQADEQTNGAPVRTAGADDQAARAAAVLTAANWTSLRDQVPVEVKRLAYKCFKGEKNPYQAAFRHVNQKFFYGEKWSQVREDPAKLPVAKLQEILTYLQRMTNKR